MSPSLASSDGHVARSNTLPASEAQLPHHTCDALPMFATSHFESTIGASGPDVVLSPCREPSMCTVPQFPPHWSKLAEQVRSLAASRASERATPSATAISSFPSNLAVPALAYGLVGSPFDLSPSSSIHTNSHNDLGTLNEHPPTYAAFLLTRSRAVKVSFLVYDDSVGQPS